MRSTLAIALFPALALTASAVSQGRAMTWRDVMQFRAIESPILAENGSALAYEARPDRGDSQAIARNLAEGSRDFVIERGTNPTLSADGRWFAARVRPPFRSGKPDPKVKAGLAWVDLQTGEQRSTADVAKFAWTADSTCLVWLHEVEPTPETKPDADTEPEVTTEPESGSESEPDSPADAEKASKPPGAKLIVEFLPGSRYAGSTTVIDGVLDFTIGTTGAVVALTMASPTPESTDRESDSEGIPEPRTLRLLTLDDPKNAPRTLMSLPNGRWSNLTFTDSGSRLAFWSATEDSNQIVGTGSLWCWSKRNVTLQALASPNDAPAGMTLPDQRSLVWSHDEQRLFFGYRDAELADRLRELAIEKKKDQPDQATDPADEPSIYDIDTILAENTLDVWHYRDPLINPHQRKSWSARSKRTYLAVFDFTSGRATALADATVPQVAVQRSKTSRLLGRSDLAYRREVTWDGRYADVYLVDLATGSREPVLERHQGSVSLSPRGHYLAWFRDGDWNLRDNTSGEVHNLTAALATDFSNEDHDYPSTIPGYGVAGWLEGGGGLLLQDKFDVWLVPTSAADKTPRRLTNGRERQLIFRVVDTDPERTALSTERPLLLTGYHDQAKTQGLFRVTLASNLGDSGISVEPLLSGDHRYEFLAKAKRSDRVAFTRQSYDEFPDIHVAEDASFSSPARVTQLDSQRDGIAWGQAELIDWQSIDGRTIQGALIKPDGWQPGQRCPVLVYYYRFFAQRRHQFNQPHVNHRPCFPFYASNGYAVFLPDIRFEVGEPGFAATKCLMPGIQKLIDLGVADPDAIALHGHSWSGYQTAFVITQTNRFACAIAGAPVSNMTSAYGGIRWRTGLSRQFQYEKTQSRLGATLWESPRVYIENSPLFFADRIETPLLIQFGDDDGAVPWYQGIELYMAMRRLDKDCVFLQYRGEDHHLAKYSNKLDYAIRMKEYVDHYCRGTPAPQWVREGVEYRGGD